MHAEIVIALRDDVAEFFPVLRHAEQALQQLDAQKVFASCSIALNCAVRPDSMVFLQLRFFDTGMRYASLGLRTHYNFKITW